MPTDNKQDFATTQGSKTIGDELIDAFQNAFSDKDMFFQLLDYFPYQIAIFAPDGTIVYLNRAGYDEIKIHDPNLILGRYNILKDTVVLDALGYKERLLQAFSGEKTVTVNARFPADRYNKIDSPFIKTVVQTVTCFPLWDKNNQIAYIVMVFITTGSYKGREEIVKVLEYMNQHWHEEFDREKLAKIANISPYHFTRVFKQEHGVTPQEYYKMIKLKKLGEMLLDPNFSVNQAFAACGVDVKGRYLSYFKVEFGMTPNEYRNKNLGTK